MKRFVFFLGLGVGYVLGARAGRRSYDRIAAFASGVWGSEPVQRQVNRASEAVGRAVPFIGEAAVKGVKKLGSRSSDASGK